MRDFDYAGVRIAAGTTVALAIGATHRNRDTYAEPGAFRPDRFLADHTEKPVQLFTFGHGVRSCLGMRFAQIALKLTMTRLLQVAAPVRADSSAIVHAGFWNARPRGNLLLRLDAR
jgi:cytochrome P450